MGRVLGFLSFLVGKCEDVIGGFLNKLKVVKIAGNSFWNVLGEFLGWGIFWGGVGFLEGGGGKKNINII